MNEHALEAGNHREPAPAELATSLPRPAVARSLSSGVIPLGRAAQPAALERIQFAGNRALAEINYQLQRIGTATLAGTAAVVVAVVVFIVSILPQVSAITALRNDLSRLSPPGHGHASPGPTGAALASLPSRAEAPDVVAKILEEAQASGVELPRGQYEYVPARDGVAARYRMTFPVRAAYPKIREFMDRTLVAMPAVAIEGLRIERKNVGDDSVEAELKLSAYVRSDP
jgi:hypothetical protein